jgi:hypothetical protein
MRRGSRRGPWTAGLAVGAGAGGTRQRASEGRKTSRGDIIIGRPALSLKAWPSTHETISHLSGLNGDLKKVKIFAVGEAR